MNVQIREENQLFFPETLKPYFSQEMIEKISKKHRDTLEGLLLEQALRYVTAIVKEEE